jgi:limonene-1,2-epoxide hydrolase
MSILIPLGQASQLMTTDSPFVIFEHASTETANRESGMAKRATFGRLLIAPRACYSSPDSRRTEMAPSNETVIRDFCAAWRRKNIDELLGFFAVDAVYHNIPVEPVKGLDAIRETFSMFVAPAQDAEFELLKIAAAGDVVFTERIDRFTIMGKTIALPVAGVFELCNGKITAWRDYFDLQTWMRQSGMS